MGKGGLETLCSDFVVHQHVLVPGAHAPKKLSLRTELRSSSWPQEILVQLKLRLIVSEGLRSEGKTNAQILNASCGRELPLFPSTKSQVKTLSRARGQPNSATGEHGSVCCSLLPSPGSSTAPAGLKMLQWYFLGKALYNIFKKSNY